MYSRAASRQMIGRQQQKNYMGIPLDPISLIVPSEGYLHELYLGDIDDAKNLQLLQERGVKSVLTVAKSLGIYYPRKNIANHLQNFNLKQYFQRAFEFIERGRKSGPVLVHCQAGVSRSTSIVIAYLIKKNNWVLQKALTFVRSKRKITHPNKGFLEQLKKYSIQIIKTPTLTPSQSSYISAREFVQPERSKRYDYRGSLRSLWESASTKGLRVPVYSGESLKYKR